MLKMDLKPAKLSRNSTPLELNNRDQAYTAYASASKFEAIPCLEENLQEYVSSKTDDTMAVLGNDGIICIIKKRFKVKYPLFTNINDDIDATALKEETFRSMLNACKRGA